MTQLAPGDPAATDVPGPQVSAEVPDWSREQIVFGDWEPGKYLIRSLRGYQRWKGRWGLLGKIVCKWYVCKNKFWGLICNSELPVSAHVAGGLALPHPQGIILHGECTIGPNCMLFHQVTIGSGGTRPGVPTLGGHVDVGCGAKVLGGVTVGDHARIGANAVVLCDVPPGATAVGIPARIIMPKPKAGP